MGPTDLVFLALAVLVLGAGSVAAWRARLRRAGQAPVRAGGGQGRATLVAPDLAVALSAIVGGEPQRAIEGLRRLVQQDTDAVEVYVLLGDLHREIGQVERAIRIHRSVLQRDDLTGRQRSDALTSLARDYEAAGFLDRALGAFGQVAQGLPEDPRPLGYLRTLYEQARAWSEAAKVQQRIVKLTGGAAGERRVLAFLLDRLATDLLDGGDVKGARRELERALAQDEGCLPALLHLGDVHLAARRPKQAFETWHAILDRQPEQAWLVLPRLEGLHRAQGDLPRFLRDLRALASRRPDDWRLRAFLAVRAAETGAVAEARELLTEAMAIAPTSPTVQRAAWRLAAEHGVDPEQARAHARALGEAEPFPDPLACLHCRYRTAEPRWRCPHCQRWGTFVDEPPRAVSRDRSEG